MAEACQGHRARVHAMPFQCTIKALVPAAAPMCEWCWIPSIVGVLAACGGLCYLTLLAPPLASYLYPYYLAPDAIGEPVLLLWLLIVGLNPDRWHQQAAGVIANAG